MRGEKRMLFWSAAMVALLLGGLLAGRQPAVRTVFAQQEQQQAPGMLPRPTLPSNADGSSDTSPTERARMDEQRVRSANDDRHKRLAADADELVRLSTELKTEVNNTGRDELSIEVIRKAAEIEKLAHDVQTRMKN